MTPTRWAPRRQLDEAEARDVAADLRAGRRERLDDLQFPDHFQVEVRVLRGVTVTNCTLWLIVAGRRMARGRMEGCRFRHVDLDPLTVRRADLRSNAFEDVAFGVRAMGGIHDSLIDEASFLDCRILDVGLIRVTLRGLRIQNGRMAGVRFDTCRFVDVRVATAMDDVTLVDCDFVDSDLTGSTAVDVSILDWRSADIRLPTSPSGFFVTPTAARGALHGILPRLTPRSRERVVAHVTAIDVDVVSVSERFFSSELGASPIEASLLVDTLLPCGLRSLDEIDTT